MKKIVIILLLMLIKMAGTTIAAAPNTLKDKAKNDLKIQKIILNEIIPEYKKNLNELLAESNSEEGDILTLKEIGKLHFFIGEASHNRNSIEKAISIFKTVLEKDPKDAEIKTFLGSAYTVKARDFPLKWLANITPAGYIRIYYVKKGIDLINNAMCMDSMNPVIRLSRGQTFVSLPKSFLQYETGIKDLELLLSWLENSSLNKEYSEIITDKGFMVDAYYRIGEVYLNKGEREKAKEIFKKIISINPNIPIAKIAQLRLNEIE